MVYQIAIIDKPESIALRVSKNLNDLNLSNKFEVLSQVGDELNE